MANKRIPELTEILSSSLIGIDLLLLEDMSISSGVSKKLKLSELGKYLLNNNSINGSLNGTASWALYAISASWAPFQISASYANTSSWAYRAITASYALNTLSASYARSSSYAITASYAFTSSVQLVYSSAYSDHARSASYLIYTPGVMNGTASYAIQSSRSLSSVTSSYLIYDPLIENGTASYAIIANQTISSSFLSFDGNPNGTASYSMRSSIADTVSTVTTITNDYIFREFGPYDCDILNTNTASIGAFTVTNSSSNRTIILEVYGDINIFNTASITSSGSLVLNITNADGSPISYDVDVATYQHYITSSTSNITNSLILPSYLKGKVTGYTSDHFSASLFLSGPITFYTGSRPIRMTVKANTDNFAMD